MARGVNKVIILGNLGQDPEMRNTQAGKAVANVSIATSENWTDKQSGQKQEKTEWHRVVFFDRLAEIVGQYLKKGSKVYIEGKLQTRKWQNQQGVDQYTTEIVASEMQMLDGRSENGGGQQQGGYAPQQQPAPYQAPQQQPAPYQAPQQQPAQQPVQQPAQQQGAYQPPQQGYQQPAQRQPAQQQPAPYQQPAQQPVQQQTPPPQQQPVQQQAPTQQPAQQANNEFDDDIPF